MEQLLHNVCLLLTSRTREIVKAALGFIKVILFIMDPKTLASHATVMVGISRICSSQRDNCALINATLALLRWRALEAFKTM